MLRFTLKTKTMDKLISSRMFGELLRSEEPGFKRRIDYLEWYEKLRNNFDDFLKQQLAIWQFVPCKLVDDVWVVFEKPKSKGNITSFKSDRFNYNEYWEKQNKEYQKAKERCLFKGFRWINSKCVSNDDIDIYFDSDGIKSYDGFKRNDLTSIEKIIVHNLTLTTTAKKQIGL